MAVPGAALGAARSAPPSDFNRMLPKQEAQPHNSYGTTDFSQKNGVFLVTSGQSKIEPSQMMPCAGLRQCSGRAGQRLVRR